MMTVAQAAEWSGAQALRGDLSATISGVNIDSRNVKKGDLFIALPGERTDGHNHVDDAVQRGAAAVLVSRDISDTVAAALLVTDTTEALAKLAQAWRRQTRAKVSAVTGSNGKSTVKEMLANILESTFGKSKVLRSHGNHNNHIGLPLEILRLSQEHEQVVLEMGMNHPGEIRKLCHIAQPDISVVNNAQRGHIGNFKDASGVAHAKGEIIESLAPDGVAVINLDDPHAGLWRQLAGERRIVGFSRDGADGAECRADSTDAGFAITFRDERFPVKMRVAGVHNERNALAAAAAAFACGATSETIRDGLESFRGIPGRMQLRKMSCGGTLIDDTYNANPDSALAALHVLADQPESERVLVIGDMLELGDLAEDAHREIGETAARNGIRVLAFGEAARHAADASGGVHFSDKESLIAAVPSGEDCAVLVKGSRGMHMEEISDTLCGGIV